LVLVFDHAVVVMMIIVMVVIGVGDVDVDGAAAMGGDCYSLVVLLVLVLAASPHNKYDEPS